MTVNTFSIPSKEKSVLIIKNAKTYNNCFIHFVWTFRLFLELLCGRRCFLFLLNQFDNTICLTINLTRKSTIVCCCVFVLLFRYCFAWGQKIFFWGRKANKKYAVNLVFILWNGEVLTKAFIFHFVLNINTYFIAKISFSCVLGFCVVVIFVCLFLVWHYIKRFENSWFIWNQRWH